MLTLFLALSVATTLASPFQRNSGQGKNFERIITDINCVIFGASLDYRYNESSSSSSAPGGLASSPGCPKSDLGYPWLYYKKSKNELNYKCYLAGQTGPCDYGQKLFVERGNPVGFCNCECFEDADESEFDSNQDEENDAKFCWMSPPPWGKEVVFLPESKMCHVLYEQGPCKQNEWLVKTPVTKQKNPSSEAFQAKCEVRSCPEGELPVPTDDAGENDAPAKCSPPLVFASPAFLASITENDCPENSSFSPLLQQCVKKAKFELF